MLASRTKVDVLRSVKTGAVILPTSSKIENSIKITTSTIEKKEPSPGSLEYDMDQHRKRRIAEYTAENKPPLILPHIGLGVFICQIEADKKHESNIDMKYNFSQDTMYWSGTNSSFSDFKHYKNGFKYFAALFKATNELHIWKINNMFEMERGQPKSAHPRYGRWSDKHINRPIIAFSGISYVNRNFKMSMLRNTQSPNNVCGLGHFQGNTVKYVNFTNAVLSDLEPRIMPDIFTRDDISDWESGVSGWVYAIGTIKHLREGGTFWDNSQRGIKIGFTRVSVMGRKKQLNTGDRYLKVVCCIPTNKPRAVETYLHNKLADKRLNGEWFKITERDVITEFNHIADVINHQE
jgi:hypothetical protein